MAFSPDGRRLASIGPPRTGLSEVPLWDVPTGDKLLARQTEIQDAAIGFRPDGLCLIAAGQATVLHMGPNRTVFLSRHLARTSRTYSSFADHGLLQIWDATPRPE